MFFADLTEEGELWEPVRGRRGRPRPRPPPRARDADARAGAARRAAAAQGRLPARPHDARGAQGLDAAQRLAYEHLHGALLEATPELGEPGHLLLGHPVVVQGDPREPGEVSLLHLGWDEALGFEHLDGGDLTFHADADDVRAGRWERLTVSPASG